MAYPLFHQIHKDLEHGDFDIKPDFYDTDGSPVYEDPYGALLGHIVARNDSAALRLYQDSPQTKVFWKEYEMPSWHPLFIAKERGSFDALRTLLEIYLTDMTYTEPLDQYLKSLRFSPINVACAAAQRELLLWLLRHALPNATLHDRDTFGETPLFSAASGIRRDDVSSNENRSKHEDFIYFLLDQGCSVCDSNIYITRSQEDSQSLNSCPELERTVLGAAIPNASYKLISRLIAEGAEVHARQKWTDRSSWDRSDRIQDGRGVTALHIASLFWNLEGIHALMDHHGDRSVAEMFSSADDHGRIPLHWALLGVRDEPFVRTGQCDQYESPPRRLDTAKLLLRANPDTIKVRDKQGATVFNYAVKSDTALPSILSIVKMLLDARPFVSNLNAKNFIGATALVDAVKHHSRRGGNARDALFTELTDILLESGANAHLCLHRLCDSNWLDYISPIMIDRLLELSDSNDTDTAGCTAMHYLVRHMDQIDTMRYLIGRGANVNSVNHKGNTPLHEVMGGTLIRRVDKNGMPDPSQPRDAPYRAREELIKIMVDAGGSMEQANGAGKTPTQLLDELTERRQQAERREQAARGRRAERGRQIATA